VNRKEFLQRFEEAVAAAESDGPLSLIFGDVDKMLWINDRFTQCTGDKLLRAIGRVIADRFEGRGLAGRTGGDEFAVLLPQVGLGSAMEMAEDLRLALAATELEGVAGLRPQMTFGVAGWRAGDEPEDLRMRADRALYQAKLAGRNRVGVETK
jgi:diguanylate cyclase (GGDEF)-like protein